MSADLTKPTGRPVAAPFTEHRSHPRYPFTASVEVSETESGTTNKARVSDIGLGGCYVDTNSPFSSGTSVKVRIIREKKSFQALGKVVYSLPGMGMGIQFITVEPEQLWILEKWVAEVAGEPFPESDALEQHEEPHPIPESANQTSNQNFVLHELIIALMRHGVLGDAEGKAMLQRLLR
jgi:PilZ domain